MKQILMLLITCVLTSLVYPIYHLASVNEPRELKTVRVGYFYLDGYHLMDEESGALSGYGYDILQHMSGYTNWTYEYVGYDKSWSDMQDMLERGEIDLLTSARKTKDREDRFAFSDNPIGISSGILTVKAGNTSFYADDYENWNGIRVGMLHNNSRNDNFVKFASDHNFTYSIVYYDSLNDIENALAEGSEIDAIVTSNLRILHNEWILAQFDQSPFYIIVNKNNTELLNEINLSLEKLFNDEPHLLNTLWNTYYTSKRDANIPFTISERNYIEKMKDHTFTSIISPDRAPYTFYSENEPSGIIYDIALKVIERSGLNIKFIYAPDRVTYKTYATSDSVDIFFDTWNNYYEAEQNGYRLTVPYLNASIFRVYRKDNTKFNTVALLRDTYIAAKYRDVFETSFSEIKYYNTIDEVVDAIYTGKQDVAFFYSRTAELVSYNDITNKLIAENMYEKNVNFSVGVSAKQDTLLYSILNKCVASIGEQELEIIADKYCDYSNQPFTFIGYLYDNPFFLAFLILATSLAILLLGTILIIWQKRRREKKAYALERKTNELLTSALAAAEKADLAKSHFLSRVSHEMRTPLNAIIGFLSLSRESSPDQSQTYLSNSEVAAKHLLSVINDVLDMSAIESGKINIAHTTFDFKQLITSISEIFVSQCAQKGISFETKLLTDTDECLIGDSHRLNQILMNLLGNSLKFTSEGSIQLIISQLSPSENTIILRLKVCDTGCGMNEDMLGRLFKPFEQESADTARKYGGSGLGLSIVKNLVTLMGGAISVESELGLGSTFTIDLPFERSNTLNSTMPKLDASLESLHVLVVDDEFADCEYMSMVLGRLGIIHTCVTNGDHALKEIQDGLESNHPYDMCLIDFKMPDMDGIEVTKQIRSAFGKDMIVIVISAYEQYQMTESVKNSGANLFVSKPLFQSTLLDLFMTITGGSATKTPTNLIKYDLSNHRILLAEDNIMNRMVAVGLIEKMDVICEIAEDGEIALNMFLHSEPGYYDAILMDIQMPNLDGLESTKQIRASSHPDAKSIQIIALSADAFNEDITRSLSAGMNNHVGKPIEPELLQKALYQAFLNK